MVKPSASLAARVMRTPSRAISWASSGNSDSPSAAGSTKTKLSPHSDVDCQGPDPLYFQSTSNWAAKLEVLHEDPLGLTIPALGPYPHEDRLGLPA
jgi:hypothetical protein